MAGIGQGAPHLRRDGPQVATLLREDVTGHPRHGRTDTRGTPSGTHGA
uniref:Uncharacterized protein n=1 Tax=Streptomyces sp. FXJ1.235 TaxID=1454112 RepID=A0A2R3ZPZ1_9ACTN|nr:hypothetical protein [Streptomyces sp. FXJ1.235]